MSEACQASSTAQADNAADMAVGGSACGEISLTVQRPSNILQLEAANDNRVWKVNTDVVDVVI